MPNHTAKESAAIFAVWKPATVDVSLARFKTTRQMWRYFGVSPEVRRTSRRRLFSAYKRQAMPSEQLRTSVDGNIRLLKPMARHP
jgi:hypothetical protein